MSQALFPEGAGSDAPAPVLPLEQPASSPRVEGAKILRRIADHELAIARVQADAEAQMAEITAWAQGELRLHEGQIAHLQALLAPLVDQELAQSPLRRRSVTFPTGVAGYRTTPARMVVEDAAALLAWLSTHRPEWLRVRAPEPDLRAIKAEAHAGADEMVCVEGEEPGELMPIPGVRLVQGEAAFYVQTGAGGRR